MTASRRLVPRQPPALLAVMVTLILVGLHVLGPQALGTLAADPVAAARAGGALVLVAGHRGDKAGAPENTLAAVQLALDGRSDFIETDLQLTADGVPVLFHDWTLDRTTDATGPVWSMTWEQLRRVDAGSWFGPEFEGTRIPRLEEFFDLVAPSRKRIILEIKGAWSTEQLSKVVTQVQTRGLLHRVLIASFDIFNLRKIGSIDPSIARAVIARTVVGDPAVLAAAAGAGTIVTSRAFIRSDPTAVARIREAGLGVMLYTLNDEDTWSEAVALGVDGIITDRPGALERWLASGALPLVAGALDRTG